MVGRKTKAAFGEKAQNHAKTAVRAERGRRRYAKNPFEGDDDY